MLPSFLDHSYLSNHFEHSGNQSEDWKNKLHNYREKRGHILEGADMWFRGEKNLAWDKTQSTVLPGGQMAQTPGEDRDLMEARHTEGEILFPLLWGLPEYQQMGTPLSREESRPTPFFTPLISTNTLQWVAQGTQWRLKLLTPSPNLLFSLGVFLTRENVIESQMSSKSLSKKTSTTSNMYQIYWSYRATMLQIYWKQDQVQAFLTHKRQGTR